MSIQKKFPVHLIYLLLGSNLGNRNENLQLSISLIEKHIGSILAFSSIYESVSWGYKSENPFYNQALKVKTELTAMASLTNVLKIETILKRERSNSQYTDRIIDIDILFYNNEIIETEKLKVPHPLLQNRMFALKPMAELDQNYIHPIKLKTINELISLCKDDLPITKLINR